MKSNRSERHSKRPRPQSKNCKTIKMSPRTKASKAATSKHSRRRTNDWPRSCRMCLKHGKKRLSKPSCRDSSVSSSSIGRKTLIKPLSTNSGNVRWNCRAKKTKSKRWANQFSAWKKSWSHKQIRSSSTTTCCNHPWYFSNFRPNLTSARRMKQ